MNNRNTYDMDFRTSIAGIENTVGNGINGTGVSTTSEVFSSELEEVNMEDFRCLEGEVRNLS